MDPVGIGRPRSKGGDRPIIMHIGTPLAEYKADVVPVCGTQLDANLSIDPCLSI